MSGTKGLANQCRLLNNKQAVKTLTLVRKQVDFLAVLYMQRDQLGDHLFKHER